MTKQKTACAPLKMRVILPALLGILLLAAAVCVLHGVNAVSLRGEAAFEDYTRLEPTGEELRLSSERVKAERAYALYEDGEARFALHMEQVQTENDILHIRGTLLRVDQTIDEIRMRVGLAAPMAQEAVLLNTQMVRRAAYAGENGYDDHCGFSSAVKVSDVAPGRYDVVLVDETNGAKRMMHTGFALEILENGSVSMMAKLEESEETHAQ